MIDTSTNTLTMSIIKVICKSNPYPLLNTIKLTCLSTHDLTCFSFDTVYPLVLKLVSTFNSYLAKLHLVTKH